MPLVAARLARANAPLITGVHEPRKPSSLPAIVASRANRQARNMAPAAGGHPKARTPRLTRSPYTGRPKPPDPNGPQRASKKL